MNCSKISLKAYNVKNVKSFRGQQRNKRTDIVASKDLINFVRNVKLFVNVDLRFYNSQILYSTMKQILKNLPMYCQHYESGCREIFEQDKDLVGHELACVFRAVYCPWLICNVGKIIFKDLSDHMTSRYHLRIF